jgi:phosphoenolpyruvate---glycerone phosphotransferase subunit DhaK
VKKFINNPEDFVDEMIEGIVLAHPNQLEYLENNPRCVVKKDRKKTKVGIVTGGGSGHLPLFLGYVGDGLLDGCAVGGVFQSPGADKIYEITKAVNKGMGVLYIIGNYMGDKMNFDMAAEMAEMDGIDIKTIIGMDDVASAPKSETHKRRGVAGIFYVYKAAGAMADLGHPLEEVYRVAEKAALNVRTMGVALSPCIIPEVGKPSFRLEDDEMEIGMGIHGEPGVRRGKLRSADEVVTEMMTAILADLEPVPGDEVSVLVNGLGATCKEELYIINRKITEILKLKDISIYSTYVGEFATSMEMAGFSISIIKIDEELKSLIGKSANTPFFTQFAY